VILPRGLTQVIPVGAAAARIGVATADLYPKITLGLSGMSLGPTNIAGQGSTIAWSLGPLLITWTIPDSGARDQGEQAARQARQLFTSGKTDYLTVLDAERTLAASKSAPAASQAELSADQVAVFLALGGGWEDEKTATDATASAAVETLPVPTAPPAVNAR
jgi:outer membrane protein TolC